ncbi:hypothetical protein GPALN_003069 [Globodera pallida]|nr:hypothetical protein GPALN_003069 [Globodera pallida]
MSVSSGRPSFNFERCQLDLYARSTSSSISAQFAFEKMSSSFNVEDLQNWHRYRKISKSEAVNCGTEDGIVSYPRRGRFGSDKLFFGDVQLFLVPLKTLPHLWLTALFSPFPCFGDNFCESVCFQSILYNG